MHVLLHHPAFHILIRRNGSEVKLSSTCPTTDLPCRLVEPCLDIKLPLLLEVLVRNLVVMLNHLDLRSSCGSKETLFSELAVSNRSTEEQ